MSSVPSIDGTVDPAFARVRDAFADNFARRGEVGAAVHVRIDGKPVVDLWAGERDPERGAAWEADTPAVIFSSTKGLMATAFLMLIDRGELDPEAPVARYWPEFAAAGKEAITVAQLLDHRAGLAALAEKVAVEAFADPDAVAAVLARQPPAWEPDTAQGYHATTLGAYGSILFRKVAGEGLGAFLRREIAGPLGADVQLGLAPQEGDRLARILPGSTASRLVLFLPGMVTGGTVEGRLARGVLNPRSATHRALLNPVMGKDPVGRFNDPDILELELPWANGVASARGLATVYAALARGGELDGTRLLSREALAMVEPRRSWGYDRVLRKTLGFSLGYLKEEPHLFSPHSEAFGHAGIGGSLGLADPVTKMSFGYVMNRMDPRLRSPRCLALCHAVYESLGVAVPAAS